MHWKRVAWLVAPPIAALIFVLAKDAPLSRPESGVEPSLKSPPDAACEASFESALAGMQRGVLAVDAILARPTVPNVVQVADAPESLDSEWKSISRRPSFVDAFINAPPGVPLKELHRCGDLNPDDAYIPPDVRCAIEVAVEPYYQALERARLERDRARTEGIEIARASGLVKAEKLKFAPEEPISITLQPSAVHTVASFEVDPSGQVQSDTVDVAAMPAYAFMDALHWYVAREAGCQIIAIFASFKFLPSNSAEVMTRRIVEACGRHIH